MNIKEIHVKSALHRLKRRIPYGWDLNIYRGCNHGCRYCYAMNSHDYLNADNFRNDIFIKGNIVDVLEKELSKPGWKREIVNIGGVTDSYQPIEGHKKIMPEILKLLIKYRTPAIISTKSTLVLRDYDLIDELSRITYVNVAATVTTMDESIRRELEPGAAESAERLKMLKAFKGTNASTGLHVMPIIPFLTDGFENIDEIFRLGAEAKVNYVLPGTLYLRGRTKPYFIQFLKDEFPYAYEGVKGLYAKGSAGKAYKDELYLMVNKLKGKHGLSGNYSKAIREKMEKTGQIKMRFV